MPFNNSGYLRPWVVSLVLLAGCSKSLTHSESDLFNRSGNQPSSTFTTDATLSPLYEDSVLYVQGTGRGAYLFKPVNNLSNGHFVAWPTGLTIDPNTGAIDILESETGSRYNVGFVNAFTGDTAYRQIILAGVTYPDGIYFVNSTDSVLQPYYNASATASWSSNSIFDDVPQGLTANDQKLLVNTGNGSINLKESMQKGLFGDNPKNGDTREIAIYYRLNDQSHMNLLKTNVIVHYYNTLADVPQDLIAACQYSQTAFGTAQPPRTTADATGGPIVPVTTTTPVKTATAAPPAPPCPPQVIIVNVGHH
jgi:hypothetical protein